MPETNPTPEKRVRGYKSHKPECQCGACTAQRRKAEALAARDRGNPDETFKKKVIVAEFPMDGTKVPARYRIAQWMQYRATEPDISNIEIARRMGVSRQYLHAIIKQAVREGWLVFSDPVSRIEHEIVPKTLDNMAMFLDQKDKQATIEVYKSTVAKQYLDAKGVNDAPQTVLALKIETVDTPDVKVISGHVVGKPRELKESEEEDALG